MNHPRSMFNVEIDNSQRSIVIDEGFLRDVVEKTLEAERVVAAQISVAIVDDPTIHELNRQYLSHDYATDVLSFLLECEEINAEVPSEDEPRGSGKRIDGEVIVSAETAVRRAAEFQWTPRQELVLYIVHGLLHLVGYDDQSEAEKSLMRSRERTILTCRHFSVGDGSERGGVAECQSTKTAGETSGGDS